MIRVGRPPSSRQRSRCHDSFRQFHINEVLPSYWRVTFDNGPVNLLDPDTVDQLGALIGRIENDPDLTVVVFRSDKPGYFMAHWDFLSDAARVARMPPSPTGLNPYIDNFVRLSRLPTATVSEISGRARGAGSELVLATDIRFASEKAILGQPEVGIGAVPGGGPMARLGRLAGRGRALEILLGGDDIPAALAAEYGYVNRVIPDAEIEEFTDAFGRGHAAGLPSWTGVPVAQICAVAGDLRNSGGFLVESLSAGPVPADVITTASWRSRPVVAG